MSEDWDIDRIGSARKSDYWPLSTTQTSMRRQNGNAGLLETASHAAEPECEPAQRNVTNICHRFGRVERPRRAAVTAVDFRPQPNLTRSAVDRTCFVDIPRG